MPTPLSIRERLIRILNAAEGPLSRRMLVRVFDSSRRSQADEEIGRMLNENIIAITGRGVKGDPVRVVFSAGYDDDRCKLCGHLIAGK